MRRFLPYFVMYETEGLYFSDPEVVARELRVDRERVQEILEECSEPEAINNSAATAPSKRIATLLGIKEFKAKTTTGIAIAEAVTLPTMMRQCPLFNAWIERIESMM